MTMLQSGHKWSGDTQTDTDGQTDRRTYKMVLMWLSLDPLAIFSHIRLKKRHTSKNEMNRIKENLLLPIVLQVTQVPLGL
jgi:hypothetical protein